MKKCDYDNEFFGRTCNEPAILFFEDGGCICEKHKYGKYSGIRYNVKQISKKEWLVEQILES